MAFITFDASTVKVSSSAGRGYQPVIRENRWSWRGSVCASEVAAQLAANRMADSLTFPVLYQPQ